MNNEKQIARAILDAQKMHEESYVVAGKGLRDIEDDSFGEYTKDWEECFQVACKVNCLSPNMWSLLALANHWYNDIQLWAEDVLAGKNILEEAKKEHAKMKAEEIAKGESEDKGCPCNVASTENCAQCRDTDSSGSIKNS